ncbi:type II toxin-antitoxin system RelE/ParE family toxin [Phyllobacterium zundukense]|uniref:Plasmid maintenance system killer n=1 Tax=Phyllobacterium zundukense TaxID=1867719 RepID=A0A2N9W3K5_9HYPH|nr:type II toxin-antitoxin system RelE/ParE family toxin [Phyllobacterium zundukense]PIO46323.1 plasmid maintenance system killer [Phyllobacterium zundukense]
MIKSFRNKALANLWRNGKSTIDARMHKRILVRLDRLDSVPMVEKMNLPGFDFHALKGFDPTRYTVHDGPWCITFTFEGGHAYAVDFEQYH